MAEVAMKAIVNCETGITEYVPFTAEEIAEQKKLAVESAERFAREQAEAQAKAEAKASALVKLEALGLTEEEIKAFGF